MTAQRTNAREDRVLLERIAARDRRAFESFYRRYYRRVFAYVFRITHRQELVEEVVNDVMLIVWQTADRFEGRSQPSSWILGIAYRQSLKALARFPPAEKPPEDDRTNPELGPETLTWQREQSQLVGVALGHLPPEQRAVVELTYYHGCSYREIAEIVGCPVNTVKTRMFYARRRLREVLPDLGQAAG